MNNLTSILRLLRPAQWVKNVFVFLPLFFSGRMMDVEAVLASLVAFGSFCLAASAIYCLNDIVDVDADRQHPEKCHRPIASGQVSVGSAYLLTIVLAVGAMLSCLLIAEPCRRYGMMGIVAFYILMNVAYSLGLKQVAIVDVFIVSLGFVLRVVVGGVATGIPLSHWIVLMTFLLSLFLAFAKRRDDVVIYESTGERVRKSVYQYNLHFINQVIGLIASITMVAYIMYTVSSEVTERLGTDYLYVTSVFVLAGIIRYLQLAIVDQRSGNPTRVLLKDRFVQGCILGWVVSFILIIYVI